MRQLKVFFTSQIDTESRGIEVYNNNSLIARGYLNLCSNAAHINLIDNWTIQETFRHEEFQIEQSIEDRMIIGNKIFN